MSPAVTGLLLITLQAAPQKVTLVFGGDVIPHEPVKKVAEAHARFAKDGTPLNANGWAHIFGPLTTAFQSYDFAIVNLETPVTRAPQREQKEMLFTAPPELLDGLKAAGVDVATFANNHCLDMHPEGIAETREHLDASGLRTAGAGRTEDEAWTPLYLEKDGLRVAVIAVSRWLNKFHNKGGPSDPHVPVVPYLEEPIGGGRTFDEFFAHVRETAKHADAVIVTIHWGAEYVHEPMSYDRILARGILDAGAIAVIGHHPHVVQPAVTERLRDGRLGVVAYSLGNLVSNQDFNVADGEKRDGLLLGLELSRGGPTERVIISRATPIGIGTENRTGKVKRNVQPVLLDDELAAVDERLATLRERGGSKPERARLVDRKEVLLLRRRRVLDLVGPLPGMPAQPLGGSVPMGTMPVR